MFFKIGSRAATFQKYLQIDKAQTIKKIQEDKIQKRQKEQSMFGYIYSFFQAVDIEAESKAENK